ncbi:MAG: DNA mismatch repair protein MutT, partial [Bacteroidetes bacterium]
MGVNQSNPWTIKQQQVVYDNPWIAVVHHNVTNIAGNDGVYGVVQFKNLALGILVLNEFNETWLVGQYRFPMDKYTWEIPEGGGLKGVEPLVSAKRE